MVVKLLLVLGLALLGGGLYAIVDGWPYLVIERGFTEVIVGTVAVCAGLLMLAQAYLLAELRRVRAALDKAATLPEPEPVAGGVDRQFPVVAAAGAVAAAAVAEEIAVPDDDITALVERQPELPFPDLRFADEGPQQAESGEEGGKEESIASVREIGPEPEEEDRSAPAIVAARATEGDADDGLDDLRAELSAAPADRFAPSPAPPEPLAESGRVDPEVREQPASEAVGAADFDDGGGTVSPEPAEETTADGHGSQDADAPADGAQASAGAEGEPSEQSRPPAASEEGVIGAYQVGDAHFTMYADGSIKAATPDGDYTFASMDELKTYLASEKSKLGV